MSDMNVSLRIKASAEGTEEIKRTEGAVKGVGDAAASSARKEREAAEATRELGDAAQGAAPDLSGVKDALTAIATAAALQDLVRTAAQFEAMEKGLEALTGSSAQARAEMDYITKTADRLGISAKDAAESYVSLSAATKGTALEGQNTRAIFESVSSAMAKLGKSSAETQQAMAAIGQMASKGTVSMEELRGQLGEALPGAMQAAARAMGVTVSELDKLVSSGKVTAEELLPKLAAELTKTFGTEPPETINAALARLQNKLDLAYKTFGETGSMEVFKAALDGVGKALESVAITASGAWESVELTGKGIAAVGAAMAQAATGDFAGAWMALKANISEAMDQAATDIQRVADTVTGAGQQVESTAPQFLPPAQAAEQLASKLREIGQEGTASSEAIAKAFHGLDLTTAKGVQALVDAFTLLGAQTKEADKALSEYIGKMAAADLSAFRAQVEALYQGGQVSAERFAQINDQVLAASFKALGLSAEQALGRITPAASQSIAAVDGIRAAVVSAADGSAAKMQALEMAMVAALGRADTLASVEAIRGRIESMGRAGELTAEQVRRLNAQLAEQRVKVEQGIPGIQSMEEAYRALGMTSAASLRDTARSMQEAYSVLERGGAPAEQLNQAWLRLADAQLAAAAGAGRFQLENVAAMLSAQAGAKGLQGELDNLIRKYQGLSSIPAPSLPAPRVQDIQPQLQQTETQYNDWANRIAGATDKFELDQLRRGLSDAWKAGELTANQYFGLLDKIDTKQKDIEEGAKRITLEHDKEAMALADAAKAQDALFKAFQEYQKQFFFSSPAGGRTLDAYYQDVYDKIYAQKAALDEVTDSLKQQKNMAMFAAMSSSDAAQYIEQNFSMLNESLKNGLLESIKDAKRRFLELEAEAKGTLSDLQSELDELTGNYDEIEKRRASAKREELQAKLDAAKSAGNTKAVADYQEALRVLDQISKARIADAAAREAESTSRSRASAVDPRATSPTKTVNVRLTLPNGQTKSVPTIAGGEDALIEALETMGYRS